MAAAVYARAGGILLPVAGLSRVPCAARTVPGHTRLPFASCSRLGIVSRSYGDKKLDLRRIDQKWQKKWHDNAKAAGPPQELSSLNNYSYILPMFPYPSGTLHIGHLRVYTIADVIARYHALRGNNVLLPMGWDAFGLPAENAAIERGIDPAVWTKDNIEKMKAQLAQMNGSWDWSREITTCSPDFYKHTQRIFLDLHAKGLAYQAEAEVNYDPVDKTVLANEQVDADGCSWRSGAKVEKKRLKQWFLRISDFRDALLRDLDVLEKDGTWPERVLAMQKNWLGKSEGALVKFPVLAMGHDIGAAIEVFTTRPDTLFGVQYIALAATHPTVTELARSDPELQAFLDTLPGLPPGSKVGYLLPNLRAINPMAYHGDTPDATKESLPVYVAPYVLGDYGEGAVMGVPGHDLRDHSFWREHHYDAPVRVVLAASEDESTTAMSNEPFLDHGYMTAHSGPFKGKTSTEAGEMLLTMLEKAELAKRTAKWRLRDWLVSRQRYWGTPIPIVHCDSCGAVPVPSHQLPVILPELDGHWAERRAGNPLEGADGWVNTSCPQCGGAAKRDTDTMDTFVDSSWYFMRFIDAHNKNEPFDAEKAKVLLPVDLYVGGIEHAILHLLYARFIYKFLMTNQPGAGEAEVHEPFKRLITQGMVHGKTYKNPANGQFLKPEEVDLSNPAQPKVAETGEAASISFEKMSKSKYNGVNLSEFIEKHGADPTRAHMLFQASVDDIVNWDENKIAGVTRWMDRLYSMAVSLKDVPELDQQVGGPETYFEVHGALLQKAGLFANRDLKRKDTKVQKDMEQWEASTNIWRQVQEAIGSVTSSYDQVYSLNTAVSDLMSLSNTISANDAAPPGIRKEAFSSLLRMLAPITPAFAEECWATVYPQAGSIFKASFPAQDRTASKDHMIHIGSGLQNVAVQVNGKLKCVAKVPSDGPQEKEKLGWYVREIFKSEEARTKFGPHAEADFMKARKFIVARDGRTVNFVL